MFQVNLSHAGFHAFQPGRDTGPYHNKRTLAILLQPLSCGRAASAGQWLISMRMCTALQVSVRCKACGSLLQLLPGATKARYISADMPSNAHCWPSAFL